MAENNLFTNEEFRSILELSNSIQSHIPLDRTNQVWDLYRRINNTTENQPCNCGSAAQHWLKAINSIRDYIKNNSEKYNG
jgi:hypothetical protein